MKGRQIAGWALAASVLVGVPVGGVMYPSLPVLAQRNQGADVEALLKRAVELTQQGKYAEAERLYGRALGILNQELPKLSPQQQQAIRSQVQGIVALAGINRGLLYASQGRDAEARQIWTESIGPLEQALGRNHPDVVKMRQAMATYAQQQRQTPSTPPPVSSQRTTAQSSALQEANRLNQLGVQQYGQGQYMQAIESFQRSVLLYEKILGVNHLEVAGVLNNLALAYRAQGNYSQALPLLQRSLAIREKTLGSEHPDVAGVLNNLASLYRVQGNYAQAILLYERSLAIRERTLGSNHSDVARSLDNLALAYQEQGNYSKAVALYEKSLRVWEKAVGSEHPDIARSLHNLADLYYMQGNYNQALQLYQRSLKIREKVLGSEHPSVGESLNNIGNLYRTFGEYSQAINIYQKSLRLFEKAFGSEHPSVATVLNNLAIVYRIKGDYDQALQLYQRSLKIRKKVLGSEHPEIVQSLYNLSNLYHDQRKYEQVLRLYQQATNVEEINIIRNLIIGSEEDKRAYLQTFSVSTNKVISFDLQFAPKNTEATRLALTTILRRKGRVLDTLSQNLNRLRQQLSPADQERLTRLSALRTQVAQIAFNPNPTDQQRQQLQLLNTQAEQIETELNRSSAAFAQTTQKVTLEAVQKAIPQNAALVEFIQYAPVNIKANRFDLERYAVYVLSATGEPRFADLGSASEIDALVAQYRSATLDPRRPISEAQAAARTLDAKIMAPVRQLVGSATHLLIAPDGQLNLVSFAALVDEKNQYLIERYQITYLTSGRDLLRLQNTPSKANPPLIVANPTFDKPGSNPVQIASADRGNLRSGDLATLKFGSLPATAIEGETIAKLLPNSRLFTQAQATETVVKNSSNPRILHLATHGFFLKPAPTTQAKDGSRNLPHENPLLRSGLALAGFNLRQGGGDDGVLTALEITGMDLRGTQLVVLSACETGLGDVQSGEGVYGLRRAFTLAGAQSQVMTLWRVEDEATKDLMVAYYQRLNRGEERGEALRQAQLALLKDARTAHPRFWSGFIFAGDWRRLRP